MKMQTGQKNIRNILTIMLTAWMGIGLLCICGCGDSAPCFEDEWSRKAPAIGYTIRVESSVFSQIAELSYGDKISGNKYVATQQSDKDDLSALLSGVTMTRLTDADTLGNDPSVLAAITETAAEDMLFFYYRLSEVSGEGLVSISQNGSVCWTTAQGDVYLSEPDSADYVEAMRISLSIRFELLTE